MIKLTNILNELNVNNPNVTAEKAQNYYLNNIWSNGNEFGISSEGWKEYKKICYPYCQKYGINGWLGLLDNFQKLSKFDLNTFYREMRALVRKHNGTEILNELNINK